MGKTNFSLVFINLSDQNFFKGADGSGIIEESLKSNERIAKPDDNRILEKLLKDIERIPKPSDFSIRILQQLISKEQFLSISFLV